MPSFVSVEIVSAVALCVIALLGVGAGALQHGDDSPAVDLERHRHLIQKKLEGAMPMRRLRKDKLKVTLENELPSRDTIFDLLRPPEDDTCPGSSFLWKIVEDSTGKHVGFGLGTMHLPPEIVTTPEGLASIHNAIEDSCDVYGEVNLLDEDTRAEVRACAEQFEAASATVNDVPDEALREAIEKKAFEIATALAAERAEEIASRILTLPLETVLDMIVSYNTLEYREIYLDELRSGKRRSTLDGHVLTRGRPSGGLEKTSTSCEIFAQGNLTPDVLIAHWDELSPEIKRLLHANMSRGIHIYKCGHSETFHSAFESSCDGDNMMEMVVCTRRNIQMATKMNEILKESPNEKVLFAVGAAHWHIGRYSLAEVLQVYGYSLHRLESWDDADAVDYTDEQCGVVFDPTQGYYVPDAGDDAGATATSSTAWIVPNVRSASLRDGAGEVEEEQLQKSGAKVPESSAKELPSSSSAKLRRSYLLLAAVLACLLA